MNVTPYAAAKIVNALLEKDGFDSKIPPQMMYNYIKPNKSGVVKIASTDGLIDLDDLTTWYNEYSEKKRRNSVDIDVDAIAEELIANRE